MNTDSDALLREFESGRFVRPDWSKPNPVALARAVSGIGGYSPWPEDPVTAHISERVGESDHTVFVIADGFGMNFVRTLPEASFARTQLVWEQPAAFPSSTGPNMTSLFSGEYPASHGFVGWWVYLPQIAERATVYEWVRRSDGKDLSSLGVNPRDVLLAEPFPGKLKVDCKLFMPSALKDSLPTLYSNAGGALVRGFEDINEGVEKVVRRVRNVGSRSITLLYWNLIDVSAHVYGVDAPETAESVNGLDAALSKLANALDGKARVVVTADHGHLDVPGYAQLDPSHALARLMKCTQSGEPRANYFHVREGHQERFAGEFRDEFGEHFFLLSTDEVVEMRLLGPEPPTAAVLERLGDFMAISRNGVLVTSRALGDYTSLMKSSHGGMSSDEMMVPVLLA